MVCNVVSTDRDSRFDYLRANPNPTYGTTSGVIPSIFGYKASINFIKLLRFIDRFLIMIWLILTARLVFSYVFVCFRMFSQYFPKKKPYTQRSAHASQEDVSWLQ